MEDGILIPCKQRDMAIHPDVEPRSRIHGALPTRLYTPSLRAT
jgi:hypothetical protein